MSSFFLRPVILLTSLLPATVYAAPVAKAIYSFGGSASDGFNPYASLAMNTSGDFFGITYNGGADGFGTVYKVTAAGKETVLYSFSGGTDGAIPLSTLIFENGGKLYGTTQGGGKHGYGTIFRLAPPSAAGGQWKEKVLYSFAGGSDGYWPESGLVADSAGNFYGTTANGGANGFGTVYELSPGGVKTILYAFAGYYNGDGQTPSSGLVRDAVGNLYGMTNSGGKYNQGISFKLTPTGVETVLNNFGTDGEQPFGGLIFGKGGALFGTTAWGGANGEGAVVKVTP